MWFCSTDGDIYEISLELIEPKCTLIADMEDSTLPDDDAVLPVPFDSATLEKFLDEQIWQSLPIAWDLREIASYFGLHNYDDPVFPLFIFYGDFGRLLDAHEFHGYGARIIDDYIEWRELVYCDYEQSLIYSAGQETNYFEMLEDDDQGDPNYDPKLWYEELKVSQTPIEYLNDVQMCCDRIFAIKKNSAKELFDLLRGY